MTMEILSKNLAEGSSEQPEEVQQVKKPPEKTQALVNVEPTEEDEANKQQEWQPKVHTFLRFTFILDKFIIDLCTGGAKSLSAESPSRSAREGLARFSLEFLSIKGRILSDSSIITSILLVNCLLDDTRKGREGKLTRLIYRSAEDEDESSDNPYGSQISVVPQRSMIDVTCQMKEKDMFVEVRVFSFTLIVSLDYLMKIAAFFQTEADVKEMKTAITTTAQDTPKQIENQTQSQMTINLKVEKPDIILVENMDSIDTNALILNSEIVCKLRTSSDHQVISGTIKDLQLFTCCYNPEKRSETKGHVLYPVTISLAGSTPEGKGLHMELLMTDMHIRVSPTSIELLNNVSAALTASDTKKEGDEEEKNFSNVWNERSFQDKEFWFLKPDFATDAIMAIENESLGSTPSKIKTSLEELCIISMPVMMITVEAGVGNKTLPMLLLESGFKGTVRNWSSQMSVDASLTLQMGYFNSRLALWEPLIEPVEVIKNNKRVFVPWELKLDVSMGEQEEILSPTVTEASETEFQQQPAMNIDITSENNLELTITKSSLEALDNLGQAFSTAISTTPIERKITEESPFKVVNELGTAITIMLERGSFQIFNNIKKHENVLLENGAEIPLELKSTPSEHRIHLGREFGSTHNLKDQYLSIKVKNIDTPLDLPVNRADKHYFSLNYRGGVNDNWGLICDVKVDYGVTIITIRSVLQVYNHFNVPIDLYYMTVRGNELALITTIQPHGVISVPIYAVYTPTNELFFTVSGYSVTTTPYIWKDLQTNLTLTETLKCEPKDRAANTAPFIIKAIGEMEQVYFETTFLHTMASTCYNIHLRPSVLLNNCLPYNIVSCMETVIEENIIKPGDVQVLPNLEPGKSALIIRLENYLDKDWSCRETVTLEGTEFSVWSFYSYDSQEKRSLDLGMHRIDKNGTIELTLYCPFWMLNKTGLFLSYRSSDEGANVIHHPADFNSPILFSFNAKNFFGKKKAAIKVMHGEWSDKFSIDVAGSSGTIICKDGNSIYQVGVHNQLTHNGLTKQVTFTPYYVIINNAPYAIECQEFDRPADPWIKVESKSCSAIWPKTDLDDKSLILRVYGTKETTPSFLYTESHTTLLKLYNKYGGINVDIQITEGGIYINLCHYEISTAPALIINHTKYAMNFWEKHSVQIKKLPSKHCLLYTWDNPSGDRVLVWEGGQKQEIFNDLRKDDLGEYNVTKDYDVYWVSFLDGMQRILLFTDERIIAENAQAAKLFEIIQQEITVSIHGIGLSLINNKTRQEIMYIAIASSGVIWEYCRMGRQRFKQFSNKISTHFECAYQRYLLNENNTSGSSSSGRVLIDNKYDVDFKTNLMIKPNKKKIRRTFQTGLWLNMKSSPSQFQLHAKVNRLQIDNQIYDCIFPVILAPVPPPKSVAIDSGIKPFVEISIVQLLMKNSQIKQYKYFKVLVQEFHIKVDMGFINLLFDTLQYKESTEEEIKKLFLEDCDLVNQELYSHVSTQSLQEQKSFYDLLHFSPLKIHISFSMASGSTPGQAASTPGFLNVLLQGLGVTLTDLQDVVFKLAYFERDYTFLTQKQLINEATTHYIGQTIKQLYVLVLGLDVLGNPYGLVVGIGKGFEDLFYEPFQGAIQGPGEFAEGIALGVRSLFGHTVGGAAGAVSRITGAMGKGIAALTFDEDYQRKRRDQINKKPATVQEGLARSGKGLVMGVVDGVTGVFSKPISGAKEQGAAGFFKGLGLGAVGLVTRPVAGVADFASGTMETVKNLAESKEDANRIRPPRFLPADGLVKPYNRHDAEGNKLLMEIEKGKFATTDVYEAHYTIVSNKETLLLTNKRVLYVSKNEMFGGWQVDWNYRWDDLQHPITVVTKGVAIPTSRSKSSLFRSNDNGKIIIIGDPQLKEEVCHKMESLRTKV